MRNCSGRADRAACTSSSGRDSITDVSAEGSAPVSAIFEYRYQSSISSSDVDERVREDPVDPRLDVCAFLELVEGPVGPEERLLDEVLGIGGAPRQAVGGRVQAGQERERFRFEARLQPLLRLDLSHASP